MRLTSSRHRIRRQGVAPLEFIMALPFLLLMAAVIYSTGRLGIARVQVAMNARQEAWKQSENAASSQPLFFVPQNPIRQTKQREVPTLAAAGPSITVRSKHAVLGGTWDHREVRPDTRPFETMALLGASNGLGQAQGLFGNLGNFGAGLLGNFFSLVEDGREQMAKMDEAKRKVQEEAAKARKEKMEVLKEIQEIESKLKEDQKKVEDLREQLKKAAKMEDEKKRKEAVKRIENEITMVQREITRLQTELKEKRKRLKELEAIIFAERILP